MTKVCTWFYKPICIYTFCCSICFCSNSWVFFWSSNFFLVISAFCCCCWWSCFLWRGWVGPLALTGGCGEVEEETDGFVVTVEDAWIWGGAEEVTGGLERCEPDSGVSCCCLYWRKENGANQWCVYLFCKCVDFSSIINIFTLSFLLVCVGLWVTEVSNKVECLVG